ncbi:MAG: hypothetical protein EOL95_02880 [Bacteroidia bacterium]|nr:hypothetical protein [Bacteroidia bacterium]
MIREIINFTENLIEDIPEIMQYGVELSQGIHVVVELNNEENWVNKDEIYVYSAKNKENIPISELVQYEQMGSRVGTTMNKVLDKKKQIFSCSPYILSFKKKSFTNDKLDGCGKEKIIKLLDDYFENARNICLQDDEQLKRLSIAFKVQCVEVISYLQEQKIIDEIKDDDYISLYLKNATKEQYIIAHDAYLKEKLFNSNDYNKTVNEQIFGLSGFLNGLNSKKPFLEHKTSANNINVRISSKDAKLLNDFETLLNNNVLPNPLPIIIDKRELNQEIINLFNGSEDRLSFREILSQLFSGRNISHLSDFYLINYVKRKSIILNDVDFVPLLRYRFDTPLIISNIFKTTTKHDDTFKIDSSIEMIDIFDFERIVVKIIFNNSLVRIKDDKYLTKYFDDIDPTYVSGGDIMYLLIMKYRKAFYDYIYKSKTNAITCLMFDDIMIQSILSNIKKDEVSGLFFSWNKSIKEKLNIWFSIYNLFNNNFKQEEKMVSKVTNLILKMSDIALGEDHIESPEEFAFGAGQIASYLIDQSVASDKKYSLLEPYLQKHKSGQLQDAIAQTITIYKHEISTYKGAFHKLSSEVLTYDGNVEFKPLLKYFLAGCFSNNVIYSKKDKNNSNNQ